MRNVQISLKKVSFQFNLILIVGLACEDCLRASGEDLTLAPDTDPIWHPKPEAITQPRQHSKLSSLCIWAIRYYLYSISPKPSEFRRTMFRMCAVIEEFGPTVIECVGGEHPFLAYHVVGQIVRCEFARKKLGDGWGTEKAEKTKFIDIDTNKSSDAIEFIRDGFMRLKKEPRLQLNLNA